MEKVSYKSVFAGKLTIHPSSKYAVESIALKKDEVITLNDNQIEVYKQSLAGHLSSGNLVLTKESIKPKKAKALTAGAGDDSASNKEVDSDDKTPAKKKSKEEKSLILAKTNEVKKLQEDYAKASTPEERKEIKEKVVTLKKEIKSLK